MDIGILGEYLGKWILDGLPSILGGAFSFLMFFFVLSPRVKFVSLVYDDSPNNLFSCDYPTQYKIGIRNRSLHIPKLCGHSIYSVKIKARLTIPLTERKSVFLDIPIDNDLNFEIPSLPAVTANGRTRWYTLCYKNARGLHERLKMDIGLMENFTLEDLLAVSGAKLTIYVTGRGQYTGQEKDFETTYTASDVIPFRRNMVKG